MSKALDQNPKENVEIRARELHLGPLTEDHWKVVNFVRDYYRNHGQGPNPYEIHKGTGLWLKRLVDLFPCGITRGAFYIAGLPLPIDAPELGS